MYSFVVVQLLIHVQYFSTPWTAALQASLSFTVSCSLLKLMSIESVMPSTASSSVSPFSSCPLSFPSVRVFSSELILHIRSPKYWSFSFSISCPSEYSGLISFSIDWFDLPAVQTTLKSYPAPRFKSTNSSVPSSPYGPIFTSTHDYWKNHSFD